MEKRLISIIAILLSISVLSITGNVIATEPYNTSENVEGVYDSPESFIENSAKIPKENITFNVERYRENYYRSQYPYPEIRTSPKFKDKIEIEVVQDDILRYDMTVDINSNTNQKIPIYLSNDVHDSGKGKHAFIDWYPENLVSVNYNYSIKRKFYSHESSDSIEKSWNGIAVNNNTERIRFSARIYTDTTDISKTSYINRSEITNGLFRISNSKKDIIYTEEMKKEKHDINNDMWIFKWHNSSGKNYVVGSDGNLVGVSEELDYIKTGSYTLYINLEKLKEIDNWKNGEKMFWRTPHHPDDGTFIMFDKKPHDTVEYQNKTYAVMEIGKPQATLKTDDIQGDIPYQLTPIEYEEYNKENIGTWEAGYTTDTNNQISGSDGSSSDILPNSLPININILIMIILALFIGILIFRRY